MPSDNEKDVYFVRHGESDSNVDLVYRGKDALLTEKGKEQARIVAERIERIGVDAIISSPYPRTMKTAEAIAERVNLPIEESELFVERRRPSTLAGLPLKGSDALAIIREMTDGYLINGHRHSDEENLDDLRTRANAALGFLLAHPAQRICVVSHGMFLRVLFCAILDPAFTGRDFRNAIDGISTSNTGVSHIRYQAPWQGLTEEKRWIVASWNDRAHLG